MTRLRPTICQANTFTFFTFSKISNETLKTLNDEKAKLLSIWKSNISDLTSKTNEKLQTLRRDGFLLDPKDEDGTHMIQVTIIKILFVITLRKHCYLRIYC